MLTQEIQGPRTQLSSYSVVDFLKLYVCKFIKTVRCICCSGFYVVIDHISYSEFVLNKYNININMECGCAVVRTPALESQGCEFDFHWVSTLATLGKLLT